MKEQNFKLKCYILSFKKLEIYGLSVWNNLDSCDPFFYNQYTFSIPFGSVYSERERERERRSPNCVFKSILKKVSNQLEYSTITVYNVALQPITEHVNLIYITVLVRNYNQSLGRNRVSKQKIWKTQIYCQFTFVTHLKKMVAFS